MSGQTKTSAKSHLLDHQSRDFLDAVNAFQGPPFTSLSPAEIRKGHENLFFPHDLSERNLCTVEERFIEGPDSNQIRLRIYRPDKPSGPPLPVALFYHGGGLMVGSLELYDAICQRLCHRSGVVLVSVDYRLAPEHKYPSAHNDSYRALEWVAENAEELDVDPERIAVIGDSGGGLLAAAAARQALEEGGPGLCFQLLIYPALGKRQDYYSYKEFSEGYFGTPDQLAWFYAQYLTSPDQMQDPRVSPILAADFSALPPTFILTAGHDILRDEAEHYAALLKDAGVEVTLSRYESTFHPFLNAAGTLDVGKKAIDECAARLRATVFWDS